MKTLIAALVAGGVLVSPTPIVVKERLIGFDFYKGNVISLVWDLDNNNEEDLRVFYQYRKGGDGGFTLRPSAYFQDINFNGTYEESEMFKTASDQWKMINKKW